MVRYKDTNGSFLDTWYDNVYLSTFIKMNHNEERTSCKRQRFN